MRVCKWGNSLAIRLPAKVVAMLELEEGDHVDVEVGNTRTLKIRRDRTRDDALERLASMGWELPEGFRFSREEANRRGPIDEE